MKKLFVLISLLLLCSVGFAKENKAERKKDRQIEMQHSIEITTGYPSYLLRAEFPWFNPPEGKEYKKYYQPGLNLGYIFSWNKRWELQIMANIHMTMYDTMQYPIKSDVDLSTLEKLLAGLLVGDTNVYDYDADMVFTERSIELNYAFSAACRYKWLVRDNFSMYSSLGAGFLIPWFRVPCIYVAPVGIKFGKGRVYGIAELNFTPANMYGMAGIGVRL